MKYLRQVKALAEKGVDESDDQIYGFHGTSIEAIMELAIKGKLPVTGQNGTELHFCPKTGSYEDVGGAYKIAQDYAKKNAARNRLIRLIKEKVGAIDREFLLEIFIAFDADERWFNFSQKDDVRLRNAVMKCLGVTSLREFQRLLQSIESEVGGIILGVRKSIMRLKPHPGAVDDDLAVEVPLGLSVRYIGGIEPMKQYEWDEIFNNDFKNVKLLY